MKKNFVKSLSVILTGLLFSKPKSLAVVSNLSKNFLAFLFDPRFYRSAKVSTPIYLAKFNFDVFKKKI